LDRVTDQINHLHVASAYFWFSVLGFRFYSILCYCYNNS